MLQQQQGAGGVDMGWQDVDATHGHGTSEKASRLSAQSLCRGVLWDDVQRQSLCRGELRDAARQVLRQWPVFAPYWR
eukprot:1159797-Pelagomonas_calceolata.AAC.5